VRSGADVVPIEKKNKVQETCRTIRRFLGIRNFTDVQFASGSRFPQKLTGLEPIIWQLRSRNPKGKPAEVLSPKVALSKGAAQRLKTRDGKTDKKPGSDFPSGINPFGSNSKKKNLDAGPTEKPKLRLQSETTTRNFGKGKFLQRGKKTPRQTKSGKATRTFFTAGLSP